MKIKISEEGCTSSPLMDCSTAEATSLGLFVLFLTLLYFQMLSQ